MALQLTGLIAVSQQYQLTAKSFAILNLKHSGMEQVAKAVARKDYEDASQQLLAYFRSRKGALTVQASGKHVNANVQQLADDILQHQFKPHKGYGTFDYGKDINWQYRPVQDQLLSTFLHRTTFWESLASVYLATGDEKYAREWILQVQDYIKKNRQGAHPDDQQFAWKAFVVSFRLNNWASFFNQFINSPHFTRQFLMEFLQFYNEQANYVMAHYTDIGNHRLYEAEHLLLAGTSFPEMVNAGDWRRSGIDVLNAEIVKQVYPDGMQFELSPGYHIGTIGTFLRALKMVKDAGLQKEFPERYSNWVEKMVLAVPKFTFPDYSFPLYGNSFLTTKATMLNNYQAWSQAFPENKEIQYFATDRKSGEAPQYLSGALKNAGFYAFRNGWNEQSTVMQIKAGPPAEFHSHPDNGNFVLWVKGRDFTPDAGSFVYANVGNNENAKRDWYRSTKAHQTLTLNDQNITNDAKLKKWETTRLPLTGKKQAGTLEILSYTNPSYKKLDHQRSFLFVDQSFFIIIDKASGEATGKLGIHFNFKEDVNPVLDKQNNLAYTTYDDGNNLLIQNLNPDRVNMREEASFVSYEYQKETPRPAFVFEKMKTDTSAQTFVTVVYPYNGSKPPEILIKENAGHSYAQGHINLTLTINGKSRTISTNQL